MKATITVSTLLLSILLLVMLATASCSSGGSDHPDMPAPLETREQVLDYVKQVVDGKPRYRNWNIFPSNVDPASGGSYDKEYYLKRLGLPVHGRWVSTYVNDTAFEFLSQAIEKAPQEGRLEMPVGSVIVKENFRTGIDFKAFNNTDTQFLPAGGPDPRPAVLTILYKVGEEFCQSGYKFNGMDCFGGSWLWIFNGVNPLSHFFDAEVDPQTFCMNCHAPAYNSDYLRSLQSQRRSVHDSQESLVRTPGTPATGGDVCEGLSAASPQLPFDVPLDPSTVSNAQKMFDCVSWKTFAALNWPANPTDRGQPNTQVTSVKDPAFLSGPRVWQSYKETYEVFQPTQVDWDPSEQSWNAPPPEPAGQGCQAHLPTVGRISKSQSRSASTGVANETGQAFAGSFGTLKDQNKNLVRYEVRFNRDEFDYILKTKSAVTKNLFPSGPENPDLPDNKTGQFGGAIEVKAAWREMCTQEWETKNQEKCFPAIDNPVEYYTQEVQVYFPAVDGKDAFCETKQMGLIALHIAHKTHWAPQWIWSTFSFKNNVPNANDPHAQSTPFFNAELVPTDQDACWQKPFLISPEGCPNVELNRFAQPAGWNMKMPWPGTDAPNQITRLQPIRGSGLNETFSKLFAGTPFENYVLLDTQWPFNGRGQNGEVNTFNCAENTFGANCFTMIPRYLRNPVVESYMSTYNYQRQQYSNRSCMSCHTSAGANASYVWLDGVEQVVPIR